MDAQKIKAASLEEAANEKTLSYKKNCTTTPRKWERVLKAFVAGKSFNRFESERYLSDHTLHSTVSYIQSLGVIIQREFETVPGYMGIPTRVCRYWIDRNAVNLKKAKALLAPTQLEACNE